MFGEEKLRVARLDKVQIAADGVDRLSVVSGEGGHGAGEGDGDGHRQPQAVGGLLIGAIGLAGPFLYLRVLGGWRFKWLSLHPKVYTNCR